MHALIKSQWQWYKSVLLTHRPVLIWAKIYMYIFPPFTNRYFNMDYVRTEISEQTRMDNKIEGQ